MNDKFFLYGRDYTIDGEGDKLYEITKEQFHTLEPHKDSILRWNDVPDEIEELLNEIEEKQTDLAPDLSPRDIESTLDSNAERVIEWPIC